MRTIFGDLLTYCWRWVEHRAKTGTMFVPIPHEKRKEFVQQVLGWRGEGKPVREIAGLLGLNVKTTEARVAKPWFKKIAAELEQQANDSAIMTASARARMHKLMSTAGIEFLESCLEKQGGKFVSRADARWATDRLLPATGLNEAEDSRRRLGDIKLGVIMAQQAAIRASDAKIHVVEVKALPAPAEAPELLGDDEGNDLDELGMPESPSPVPAE